MTTELTGSELLTMNAANNRLTSQIDRMKEQINIVNDLDLVIERLKKDNIDPKELSDEQLETLFDGIEFVEGINDTKEFRVDYLSLVLSVEQATDAIKSEQETLKDALEEHKEEVEALVGEHGSMINLLYHNVQEGYDKAKDEKVKEAFAKLRASLDDSFDQTRLLNALEKTKPANFLYDYVREERQIAVMERYEKVKKKLRLQSNILNHGGLEAVLPDNDKYKDYPNMFAFAVLRYMSYNKEFTPSVGLYLSQTITNMQDYIAGTMSDEYKERFEKGVKSVIDAIIYNKI